MNFAVMPGAVRVYFPSGPGGGTRAERMVRGRRSAGSSDLSILKRQLQLGAFQELLSWRSRGGFLYTKGNLG